MSAALHTTPISYTEKAIIKAIAVSDSDKLSSCLPLIIPYYHRDKNTHTHVHTDAHTHTVRTVKGPTRVCELPADCEHDLAVAGGVGHQLQDLLVGLALHRHAIDAQQLVARTQAAVLLRCAQRHDGANVHLVGGVGDH